MSDHSQIPDRILDLILRRSTEGISEQETAELHRAIEEADDRESLLRQVDEIEFTAAAIGLTDPRTLSPLVEPETSANRSKDSTAERSLNSDETLPDRLRHSILEDAGKFFAQQQSSPGLEVRTDVSSLSNNGLAKSNAVGRAIAEPAPAEAESKHQVTRSNTASSSMSVREALALLAAAAAIMLLLSGYNPFAKTPALTDVANRTDQKAPFGTDLELEPTLSERLETFIDSNRGKLTRVSWTPVSNENAAGEVIWSDDLQKGFMCFTGMNVNDSETCQYQLWIFDTDRAQKYPVDGGVFDIESVEGQSIVEIDARIPVKKAVQFAVTVEVPGGTVVSERQNIPVLATVPEP